MYKEIRELMRAWPEEHKALSLYLSQTINIMTISRFTQPFHITKLPSGKSFIKRYYLVRSFEILNYFAE